MAKPFTRLSPLSFQRTLARRFIPLADSLRDLLTFFGLRAYQVRLVRTQWTGRRRGAGEEQVIEETLLEPTPKIGDLTSLTEVLQPGGIDEIGTLEVSQISGRYTEDQLRGLGPGGEDIPPDQQFYWEIEFFKTDGEGNVRRRFYVRGTPNYYPGRLQWVVRLERSHEDRDRDGTPR